MKKERGTVRKNIRFTPDEWEKISAEVKKEGVKNPSHYIREKLLTGKTPTPQLIPNYTPIVREVAYVGNNINQIIRYAYTGKPEVNGLVRDIKASIARIDNLLTNAQQAK